MQTAEVSSADLRIQKGAILVYRVFDVAEEVNLTAVEQAIHQFAGHSRLKIARGSRALVMRNPPLRLGLGEVEIRVGGEIIRAEAFGTLWDYGVLSILFQIPIAPGTRWEELIPKASLLNGDIPGAEELDAIARLKSREVAKILEQGGCLKKPSHWEVFEDYVIHFIESVSGLEGPATLGERRIAELILGESSARLSQVAVDDVSQAVFQYATNDLVAIDWNAAIVVEPSGQRDIPDVIEFALTHLLEFRYYDDLLDKRLAALYDSLEVSRTRAWRAQFSRISRDANGRFIEFSEFVERIDNSLKVVGDFYVADIYRAAIRRFRIPDWQQSVTRKLNLFARVSELLQGEINVHRGHTLEIIIIILITFEIVSALFR